jgi:hypothetical protein
MPDSYEDVIRLTESMVGDKHAQQLAGEHGELLVGLEGVERRDAGLSARLGSSKASSRQSQREDRACWKRRHSAPCRTRSPSDVRHMGSCSQEAGW